MEFDAIRPEKRSFCFCCGPMETCFCCLTLAQGLSVVVVLDGCLTTLVFAAFWVSIELGATRYTITYGIFSAYLFWVEGVGLLAKKKLRKRKILWIKVCYFLKLGEPLEFVAAFFALLPYDSPSEIEVYIILSIIVYGFLVLVGLYKTKILWSIVQRMENNEIQLVLYGLFPSTQVPLQPINDLTPPQFYASSETPSVEVSQDKQISQPNSYPRQ